MRRFAGICTDADVIPDETSILNFRRLLEQHQLLMAARTRGYLPRSEDRAVPRA
jgi:hypothetical protein